MGLKSFLRGSDDPFGIGFDPIGYIPGVGQIADTLRGKFGKYLLKAYDARTLIQRARKKRFIGGPGRSIVGSIFDALHRR